MSEAKKIVIGVLGGSTMSSDLKGTIESSIERVEGVEFGGYIDESQALKKEDFPIKLAKIPEFERYRGRNKSDRKRNPRWRR